MTKQETILAAKRILEAESIKRDEKEKNKKSGFKRSCKFERNRSTTKVVKARPLSLADSPEHKMPDKIPDTPPPVIPTPDTPPPNIPPIGRTPPDKEFIPNLPYFDHVRHILTFLNFLHSKIF